MQLAFSIIQMVLAVAIIVLVLLQDSAKSGLSSTIGGSSSETFFGKNKGRSKDALLTKLTIIAAAVFVALTLVLNILGLVL